MNKEELTWKDVKRLLDIVDIMTDEDVMGELNIGDGEQDYYEEVLRRFNERIN